MKIRIKIIVVILLVGLLITGLTACKPAEFFPKEGIWYCDELDMQLDFAKETGFAVVDSKEMLCGFGADRGSKVLSVGCQEKDCPLHTMGESIVTLEYVSLDDTTLVLKNYYGEEEYTFQRIG